VAAGIATDRVWAVGLLPRTADGRLRVATRAAVEEDARREQEGILYARSPDGTLVAVPVGLRLDRRRALELALELEDRRSVYEASIVKLRRAQSEQSSSRSLDPLLADVRTLWSEARDDISELLAVEPERADIILAALDWPWLGDHPESITGADLDRPFPEQPAGTASLPADMWHRIITEAERDEPWPQTAARLTARFSLSAAQARAVQAYLCRRNLNHAFHSLRAGARARRSLVRLADLAPAQVRTVLAMKGAQELARAGARALPPLIAQLARHPTLTTPLLHECVRKADVRGRALQAAHELGGQDALEVLGKDPALWRRWYRQARPVLQE